MLEKTHTEKYEYIVPNVNVLDPDQDPKDHFLPHLSPMPANTFFVANSAAALANNQPKLAEYFGMKSRYNKDLSFESECADPNSSYARRHLLHTLTTLLEGSFFATDLFFNRADKWRIFNLWRNVTIVHDAVAQRQEEGEIEKLRRLKRREDREAMLVQESKAREIKNSKKRIIHIAFLASLGSPPFVRQSMTPIRSILFHAERKNDKQKNSSFHFHIIVDDAGRAQMIDRLQQLMLEDDYLFAKLDVVFHVINQSKITRC